MDIEYLRKQKVGILGYGREGQSVARYLAKHGINPVLFDSNPKNVEQSQLEYYTGPSYLSELPKVDVLFRSPGIWRLQKELINFEASGGVITSQTIFFFENAPAIIIGVTGTKGKGTTTSLAYNIAKNSDKSCYLTGNIGLTEPLDFLDNLKPTDLVYYELSSFQLQDLQHSPHVGVILMTTADHLDQHESLSEYHASKRAIAEFQTENDFVIINKDYPASVDIGTQSKGTKLWFGTGKINCGIQILDKKLFSVGLTNFNIDDQLILSLDQTQLRGEHNLQNIAAAILTAVAADIDLKIAIEAAKQFIGLEHRLEFVIEKNGVKFYNDSFSTNPETAIAALRSFSEPLYLILGGSDKNLNYSDLAEQMTKTTNLVKVYLVGEIADKLEQSLIAAGFDVKKTYKVGSNFETIFHDLHKNIDSGSVVLLSPATASFDMFNSYKERGNKFKQLAKDW